MIAVWRGVGGCARVIGIAIAMTGSAPAQNAGNTAPGEPAAAPTASAPSAAMTLPAGGSLMFSDREVKEIRAAIAAGIRAPGGAGGGAGDTSAAAAPHQEEQRPPNVFVSAVVDFGGGHWTVWANGLRIDPDHQPVTFQVMSVRGNVVDIVVPGEGGGHFQLQPYQTWRSRERDIVDGIVSDSKAGR